MQEGTGADGIENQENGLHKPEGDEITGAFQLPLPVQHQRQSQQGDAEKCADDHIAPFRAHGDVVDVGLLDAAHVVVDVAPDYLHQLHGADHFTHGAPGQEGISGDPDAVKQGLIEGIHQPVDDQGEEIYNAVDQHLGKPVAHQHHTQHRQGEEEQVLDAAGQDPQKGDAPALAQTQQGHAQQSQHQIGDEAEQQSCGGMAAEPALPPQGHGVQRVAQPGRTQVAEEQLGIDQGVDEVYQSGDGDHFHNGLGPVKGCGAVNNGGYAHQQQDRV